MTENQRRVLERVSSGELSPEEALALLAEQPPAGSGPSKTTARSVLIKADLGAVTIVADPSVGDVVAVGAHNLRRSDDVVRIKGALDGGVLSDGRLLPRRGRRHALRVRVRPDLPVEVRIGAGSVHVEGLKSALKVEVELGTATLERLACPFEVQVGSGSVSVEGLVARGSSSIECDLGKVTVRLDPASSVIVTATTEAGRVQLPGSRNRPAITFGSRAEAKVGDGAGRLDIKTGAGSVSVMVQP